MAEGFSRRAFIGAAGGLLGAWVVTGACRRRDRGAAGGDPATAGYVDHEGWMLTPADKQKLAAAPPVVERGEAP